LEKEGNMNAKQNSKSNIQKPVPSAKDYESKHAAPKGLPCPKDNFSIKEPLKITTAKVEPSKAKSGNGVAVKDTPWEVAGSGHKPSVRTFAGSTTSRGGKPARASK
jgi:hypothetical protein